MALLMKQTNSPPGLDVDDESYPALSLKQEAGRVKDDKTEGFPPICAGADILLELVSVVAQISKVDEMLHQVGGSAPSESSEAEHWHKVSMQALDISRKSLQEQQMSLLHRLSSITGPDRSSVDPAEKGLPLKSMQACPEKAQSECSTTISDESRSEFSAATTLFNDEENEIIMEPLLNDAEIERNYYKKSLRKKGNLSSNEVEPVLNEEYGEDVESQDQKTSMRVQLEKLKEHPNAQALVVRKIKQLGFESAKILEEHFEQYGPVADVLIAHSITKPSAKRGKGRVRPATVGFVVMASVEGAEAVLAAGEQHTVKFGEECVSIEVGHHQPASN